MIFQHTIDAVLARRKTQTRRWIKSGDRIGLTNGGRTAVIQINGFARWVVGKDYAIHRERGVKSEPGIRALVTGLRLDRAPLAIAHADAIAEGFADQAAFVAAWTKLHKKNAADPCWVIEFTVIERVEAAA